MIGKFVRVCGLRPILILAVLATYAAAQQDAAQAPAGQQPPASQQPQTEPQSQPPSGQEASPEEIERPGRKKAISYDKWTFNVAGGASLTNGTTQKFVRGGGGIGAAGVARNYSRYFGLRLDFQ
ncbi:MAG TPA: hypothetical protein VJQ54_16055, partial [Candidatus Sulfotelmatobacter sp.]|nr:hypothetical protein [Candidatus Sulfotelmatobacter sp.]